MRGQGTLMDPRAIMRVAACFIAATIAAATAIAVPVRADGFNNSHMTYVFLLNPECDDEFRDRFDYYMHLNNTENERFFGNYEIVCMGGVGKLSNIEDSVLPLLRFAHPDDTFVFVYPSSMKSQYSDYMATKYGYQYRDAALGNTDIPNGFSFAAEFPDTIKHEMGHLATCGTWHDAEGKELDTISRHPLADKLAWCQ